MPELDDRPACLACDHTAAPNALLCPACPARLRDLLDAIRAGYGRLDARPGSNGPDGGRAPTGYGSRPPLRVAVLALTVAPRHATTARPLLVDDEQDVSSSVSVRADPDTPRNARAQHPLVVAVGQWADRARHDDLLPALTGPRTVTGECLRLAGIVEQLAARWWVGDLLRSLADTEHRLRRALGEDDAPTVLVGACPQVVDKHLLDYELLGDELGRRLADEAATSAGWRCGGQVRARVTADHAVCTRCRRAVRGERAVEQLGAAMGGAMLDLAGLLRYLDDEALSVAGLRQWAHRDGWARERHGRRTVYSLADARASYRARRVDNRERMGA